MSTDIGSGTLASNVDLNISDRITSADANYSLSDALGASPTSLDLRGGALTDTIGGTLNLQTVYLIAFTNNSEHAMTIGGANCIPLLNGSTDKISVPAGSTRLFYDPDGIAVTDGTGDLFIIDGTAADTFDLIIIGKTVVTP
jgi:hypothetical protein